jgi:hypothetical protein
MSLQNYAKYIKKTNKSLNICCINDICQGSGRKMLSKRHKKKNQ